MSRQTNRPDVFSVSNDGRGWFLRFLWQSLAGCSAVTAIALLAPWRDWNLSIAGFLSLIVILLVALRAGFWAATVTSCVAFFALDYFVVPPLFTFNVDDLQDWVALGTFEATALVVSRLSDRAQQHANMAVLQQSRVQRLYQLSRSILLLDPLEEPGAQLAALVIQAIDVESVAILDEINGNMASAGPSGRELEVLARHVYAAERTLEDRLDTTCSRILRLGNKPIGAIVLRGGDLTPLVVEAVSSTIAIALDRAHSLEMESRAIAGRRTEELRTAVLDGLAHAYKSPLTAIRAASSGLLEMSTLGTIETELIHLIDEQSAQLADLTTRLLRMAKLDSSQIRLRNQEISIARLVERVVAERAGQLGDHRVRIVLPSLEVAAIGDDDLLALAVGQFVENAAKYSPAGSPIEISAEKIKDEVVIAVHNQGPPIPFEERERIFERFYRAAAGKHRAKGTGIGLSVTKKIAAAHSGRVWMNSDERSGTTFFLSIPAGKEAECIA